MRQRVGQLPEPQLPLPEQPVLPLVSQTISMVAQQMSCYLPRSASHVSRLNVAMGSMLLLYQRNSDGPRDRVHATTS